MNPPVGRQDSAATTADAVAGADRSPLTRDRILAAAVAYADEHGIAALSMRKLATELGFEVMSLYNHVSNKDDMLDGMVDIVAAEIRLPKAEGPWQHEMRASAISAHEVLARHAWAPTMWWQRTLGRARIAYMEAILRGLRQGGLSAELTYHGYHALTMHVIGFTQQQLNFDFGEESLEDMAAEFLAKFPVDNYPYLVEHVQQHIADDEADEFEYVLDLIIDGLDRTHQAE